MRRIADRIRQALPVGLTADELAAALLAALPGDGAEDAPAAAALAARLRAAPSELEPAVAGLLALRSSAERHVPPMLGSLLAPRRPDRVFISLGTHCFSASLLRRWGLREWSGPFDWLFSSAAMAAHCIEDDFRTFLDRSLLAPVPKELRRHGESVNRVDHTLYKSMFGIEFIFNHHDAHEDATHAYFVRCVERFRAALADGRRKVFLLARTQAEGPLEDLRALQQALRRRCSDFRLCVVEVPPGLQTPAACPSLALTMAESELSVWDYHPASAWGPLSFEDLLDEHLLVRHLLRVAGDEALSAPA